MKFGERLKLYSGILLGITGNSLDTRFKIIRDIQKNGTDDLYRGFRINYAYPCHCAIKWISVDGGYRVGFSDMELAKSRFDVISSVFRHKSDSGYYYDILDDDNPCRLFDVNSSLVILGCCNVEKIEPKELVKFRRNIPLK